jgi:hypothetical protein
MNSQRSTDWKPQQVSEHVVATLQSALWISRYFVINYWTTTPALAGGAREVVTI